MTGVAMKHIWGRIKDALYCFSDSALRIFHSFRSRPLFSGPYIYLGQFPEHSSSLSSSICPQLIIISCNRHWYILQWQHGCEIGMFSGFALVFVWWYILSCIVVFAYNKMKKTLDQPREELRHFFAYSCTSSQSRVKLMLFKHGYHK